MKIKPSTVVFATGGASGLSKAFVQRMHKRGALIAVADVNKGLMADLRKEMGEDRLFTTECDVTDPDSIDFATNACVEKFGKIDVCLAGAGIVKTAHVPNQSYETWKSVIDVNLSGTFFTAQSCIARMLNNQVDKSGARGVVIMVSSIASTDGDNLGLSAYSATKGAINGMTLPMAREVGPKGIRVVTIAPGPIETDMTKQFFEQTPILGPVYQSVIESTPLNRWGHADDFAMMAEHCVENGYLNGTTIRLDGGMRMPTKSEELVDQLR